MVWQALVAPSFKLQTWEVGALHSLFLGDTLPTPQDWSSCVLDLRSHP